MVNSVTFPSSLGGDNSTVDDSNSPTTGLGNNGHRARFIPALSQTVIMAQTAVTGAQLATDYATKTALQVETGTYSAKEYASGDATASGGSAKAWATDASSPDGTTSKSALTWAGEAAASAATASASAAAAESSLAETENYTEIVMSVANINFANFEIVDGELLAAYIDSATSVPSIVDGELVITYY